MTHTIEYYVAKGFDAKSAEYFANGRKTIVDVTANNNFTLTLRFDNGEQRLLDMRPLLQKGTVFEPLTDLCLFQRVYLDNTHCVSWDIDPTIDSTTVWNNKIDLCPDTCYIDSQPMGECVHD